MSLAGKRIVIIGGTSGIGLATAKAAVAAGANVVIAGRSVEKLERARADIEVNVEALPLDVTQEEQVKSFFQWIDPFDHLTTPGNVGAIGGFLDLSTAEARAGFDSKFWGQYYAARYAAPKIRPGGSIVLFAGVYSQKPQPGSAAQSAINSAIEGLGRALAVELAQLRVNVVSPGLVDTPLYHRMSPKKREEMYRRVAQALPLKRIGTPEDIAQTVLYLMDNGFTTGSVLYPDGGARLV